MGYLSDWNDAERHWQEVQARFPGCLGGTFRSLGCTASRHSVGCSRWRFERGFGIWCREPTDDGLCARRIGHDDEHRGIEAVLAER